ncbi:MAG: hypothetical protein AAB733_01330 [Patescibacteria group bacterium]
MLTKEDLKQISQLIYQNVGQIIEEHVNPQFDKVWEKFDSVDERFDSINDRLNRIEATMVTKDYLDEKLANLRGDLIEIDRKEEQKINGLVSVLVHNKTVSPRQARSLDPFNVFPRLPQKRRA